MRSVAKAYEEGRIGELRHIHGYGKAYYGGYGLMNIGTHMINMMLKLAGHCRRVAATGMTDGHPIAPDDVIPAAGGMGIVAGEHLTANLDFDNGVTGTLLQHRYPKGVNPVMDFCGTEGRLMAGNLIFDKKKKAGSDNLDDALDIPDEEARVYQGKDYSAWIVFRPMPGLHDQNVKTTAAAVAVVNRTNDEIVALARY